jgi:hypothetical protein
MCFLIHIEISFGGKEQEKEKCWIRVTESLESFTGDLGHAPFPTNQSAMRARPSVDSFAAASASKKSFVPMKLEWGSLPIARF